MFNGLHSCDLKEIFILNGFNEQVHSERNSKAKNGLVFFMLLLKKKKKENHVCMCSGDMFHLPGHLLIVQTYDP